MHLNMKKWHISLCWTFASALVSWKQRDCINSDQCLSRKSREITVRSSTSVSSLLSWTQSTWTEKSMLVDFQLCLITVIFLLTHCGQVMPYGAGGLGQHCLRKWLVAWQYHANYLQQCWLIISEVLWHSPKGISWVMLNISFLDTRVSASMW